MSFEAKYPGNCNVCEGHIAPGDQVDFADMNLQEFAHAGCDEGSLLAQPESTTGAALAKSAQTATVDTPLMTPGSDAALIANLRKELRRYKRKAVRANARADRNLELFDAAVSRIVFISNTVYPALTWLQHLEAHPHGLPSKDPRTGVLFAGAKTELVAAYETQLADTAAWVASNKGTI